MHSDWARLAIICTSAAAAIVLVATSEYQSAPEPNAVQANNAFVGTAAYTRTAPAPPVKIAAVCPDADPIIYTDTVPACTSLPLVPRSAVVQPDGVAVLDFNQCVYVPWCDSVDTLSHLVATCADGRTGFVMTTIYTSANRQTWTSIADIPSTVMSVTITVTCAGRGFAVSANNTLLADMWEMPDGSGMFVTVSSDVHSITGNCIVHGIVASGLGRPATQCVLTTLDTAAGWTTVPISVVQIRKGLLVVTSTWTANSSRIGAMGWYHQPRFHEARVAAVCGTLVDPATKLAGSMVFDVATCRTRRFSMLILTDRAPTLFGQSMTIATNTSACTGSAVSAAADGTNLDITGDDMAAMHRIVGDAYYLTIPAMGAEMVVRDTAGNARALVPASGGCVVVDGWTVGSEYIGTSSYTECANPAGLCYSSVFSVSIASPVMPTAVRQVASGGSLFSVPWPPYMTVSLGVEPVTTGLLAAIRADSVPGLMLTELCGSVLVHYADPLHPIMQTHFSPSGSVDPRSVGLVPLIWANTSAVPQQLAASCGMLLLWKVGGATVASPITPTAVLSQPIVCTSTSRCVDATLATNIMNSNVNGPFYFGGNISCVY
jgi:hypothetical protein